MALEEELAAAAGAALAFAGAGEQLVGVVAAEPTAGLRVYLCAYEAGAERSWLVLDREGAPVCDRSLVRDAVSIMGLCELADETAGGGDVAVLRERLQAVAGEVEGAADADAAAATLQDVMGAGVRLARPEYLDAVGNAARELEQALGEVGSSPFAEALAAGAAAVEELALEVQRQYKRPLT